ncbi:MAG: Fic family protein [Alphaproteobacteria bacterium]|nr:Fic family protein [Alphaproteobacteria bacterium]
MNRQKIVHIWQAETGIVAISPAAAEAIAPRETKMLVEGLAREAERLKGTAALQAFNDRLRREWSLETGLIEGLYILDRGTTTTLIERGFDPRYIRHGTSDKPAEQVIETLNDHQSVLDGLYDLIKGNRAITTSYIKELHSQLTRSQSTTTARDSMGQLHEIPLRRGEWKIQPNRPVRDTTTYAYAPPEQTGSEMDRLVSEYHRLESLKLDPIVTAAWLHHRFTQIHPFQDGNGRVVRALVTLVLIRAGLTPFIVTSKQRGDYLDALEAADRDPSPEGLSSLIALIRDRCISDYSTLKRVAPQMQIDRADDET